MSNRFGGKFMFPRITEYVHELMRQRIRAGNFVVDATMGNGYDTLQLAQLVGDEGKVFAYDIQKQAIESTRQLLINHQLLSRVQLIHQSHSNMDYAKDSIDFVVFNLGYLPGSDKTVTTKGKTTVEAIGKALQSLTVGGVIVLVVYCGHEEGKKEKQCIEKYVEKLPYPEFMVLKYQYVNLGNHPPFILAIERRKA